MQCESGERLGRKGRGRGTFPQICNICNIRVFPKEFANSSVTRSVTVTDGGVTRIALKGTPCRSEMSLLGSRRHRRCSMTKKPAFTKLGFIKSYLLPALVTFLIPGFSYWFFNHVELHYDHRI